MNAYELADEFKNRNWDEVDCVLWCEKSANMLRQQADRIAELEKLVHQRFDDGKRLGVLETEDKFKSPPCAWMIKTNDGKKLMLYGEEQPPKFEGEVQYIPLYTTPQTKPAPEGLIDPKSYYIGYEDGKKAPQTKCPDCGKVNPAEIHTCSPQTKRLTDEEIHKLANKYLRTKDHDSAKVVTGLEDFARAIEERHGIK